MHGMSRMFWDPYFGWDWNEVAQALTFLAVILGFLALSALPSTMMCSTCTEASGSGFN